MNVDRLFLPLLLVALCFLSFLYGFASHRADLFPSTYLNQAIDEGRRAIGPGRKPVHLFPVIHDQFGATTFESDAVQPGLTLLSTFLPELDWRPGVRLIDESGAVLHVWDTNPEKIWPEREAHFAAKEATYVHGIHLLPNGDVLFNIDYEGMVRMDSCGAVIWKTEQKTHHSLSPDEDGNFWVSSFVSQADPEYMLRYPGLIAPIIEEHALLVSPDGEILKDINILDVVYKNNLQRYLWKISKRQRNDLVHLNDIEALSSAMANEYPLFDAGDIVISLKFMHTVFVMDPDTGVVKWHESDRISHQHDPDFIGDGWIGVFDNNPDFTTRGNMLGGSRIIRFKPETGAADVVYPKVDSERFFTQAAGKWQALENGNALITEAQAGRVFEATPDGRIVWQWVQQTDDAGLVPEITEGSRYAITPEQVSQWACSLTDQT